MSKIKRLYQVSNTPASTAAMRQPVGTWMPQPLRKPIGNILQISIQPASLQPYHTKRNESIYPCPNPYRVALATFITIAQAGNNLNSKLWHEYTVGMPLGIQKGKQLMPACNRLHESPVILSEYNYMACNHIYAEVYEIQSGFGDRKQTKVSWMSGAWEHWVVVCSLACDVTQQVTGCDCQSAGTNVDTF